MSAVTTEREFDEMELIAELEAEDIFAEWEIEFYGERGVPGQGVNNAG